MFIDLTEFFAGVTTGFRPPLKKVINPPDIPSKPRSTRKNQGGDDDGQPSKKGKNQGGDDNQSSRSPRRNQGGDDDGQPSKTGKRRQGEDADEIDNLNTKTEADLIKPTDSPADVATKKSLLSQAGDFVAAHPLLTISAAGLAYYMFTTGQSLPDAIASLGLSAGSAIGNAVESAISGLTGIPKEYVQYIWWVLLAIFLFYIFMKIKGLLFDE
jgi:hypothetical protein